MSIENSALASRGLEDEMFMSADSLRDYMNQLEMAKATKQLAAIEKADEAKKLLIKQLSERIVITPERVQNLLHRIKTAASNGQTELMVLRFPCEMCSDKGRAINNTENSWPETLSGLPRQAYEIWQEYLAPLDYKLRALIVDWPNGMPGDIGLFLSWEGVQHH